MKVACELEANPQNVTFTWAFNGTNGENVLTSEIYSELTKSLVKYEPKSENVSVPSQTRGWDS